MAMAELLEAVMLICFGVSWPMSILKTLRVRQVTGKSPAFMSLVLAGYLAGMAGKLVLAWQSGTAPQRVTALYALNAIMVGIDLGLYLRFRREPSSGCTPAGPSS